MQAEGNYRIPQKLQKLMHSYHQNEVVVDTEEYKGLRWRHPYQQGEKCEDKNEANNGEQCTVYSVIKALNKMSSK